MSSARPPLGPAFSLESPSNASSPSASSSAVAKLAEKRKMASTSTLHFFAPAAQSFQPLPYTPHAPYGNPEGRQRGYPGRNHTRPHDPLAIPGADPQPTDPDVVFLHPPFTSHPKKGQYPDGITYQAMADNPTWFLDPNDFVSPSNTNPKAIPYPNCLEPPRGWCPAKKKDLKERGSDGWPEGEEPRLRCTFCRRAYSGVNAKSMWRRHVYEKHKIAMSNRRDVNDKPRGRGTGNKENKQAASAQTRDELHGRAPNMQVAPQTNPENTAHKSKFRSTRKLSETKKRDRSASAAVMSKNDTASPIALKEDTPLPKIDTDASDEAQLALELSNVTPPASPPPNQTSDHCTAAIHAQSLLSPPRSQETESAFATPAFRHSPACLPSDRPWKFGSPSHPLHSATRDFSLTMLVRDSGSSPFTRTPAGLAPSAVIRSSPFSTPNDALRTPSTSNVSSRPFPRSWVVKGHLGSPLEKHTKRTPRDFSPLNGGSSGGYHRRTPSRGDDWLVDLELGSFTTPWPRVHDDSPYKRTRPFIEPESPIVRQGSPSNVAIPLTLLDPFELKHEIPTRDDIEAEMDELVESTREKRSSYPVSSARRQRLSDDEHERRESTPPPKRRRMSCGDE